MQNIRLTFRATARQKEAARYWADSSTKEIAYGGAKGGGKSFLGGNLIFGDAMTYNGTHHFIARAKLNDLRRYTIPTIYEVFQKWELDHEQYLNYNGQDSYFSLYNGSRVYLIDCKYLPSDPLYERFGSVQMTRGWIEEAGEIPVDAADNLRLTIGRWKNREYGLLGKILYTLNPKKNWVYKDIYRPWKEGTLPDEKKFVQAFVWDNPFISPEYISTLKTTKNKVRYQRLYKGNWEYDDDPTVLIEYDAILDAFNNDHVPEDRNDKCMTVDVAMQGSDLFVVAVWYGFVLVDILTMGKSGGKQVVDEINRLRQKHGIRPSRIVYDSDGVGGFIGGRGGFIPGAIPFINGGKALKYKGEEENYEHLKAQCSYHMADRMNAGGYFLKAIRNSGMEERCREELEQVRSRDNDKDGKIRIGRKEDVKEFLGRSPDLKDVIMMREFFELDYSRLPEMI